MYIGIDIGGTKCAVVLGDANGRISKKIKFATANKDETLANIFSAVQEVGLGKRIGISCGGPLDEKNGIILSPPNLPGWSGSLGVSGLITVSSKLTVCVGSVPAGVVETS